MVVDGGLYCPVGEKGGVEVSVVVDKYPAESAELVLEGKDVDGYGFEREVLLKVLEKRLVMIEMADPKTNQVFKQSTATWLNDGWKKGDNVRMYGGTVTALIKLSTIDSRKVELLLKFLEELHGWKEKE